MSNRYRALVRLSYPPGKYAEPGDVVADLPPKSVKWLLAAGKVEPVALAGKPAPEPKPNPAPAPEPKPETEEEG